MVNSEIKISDGYRMHLDASCSIQSGIKDAAFRIEDAEDPAHPWGELLADGTINLKEGYAWDGASLPIVSKLLFVPQSRANEVASAFHDLGYQAMRSRKFPLDRRHDWDRLFYDLLIANGMPRWKVKIEYWAVYHFAAWAARPSK